MHTSSAKNTGKFRAEPKVHDPSDRRRRARIPGKTNGWVLLGEDEHAPAREITILDISRLGVGFRHDSPMEIGSICRVRVGFGPKRLARRLKVVNCRAEPSTGRYIIGGEFA